MGLALRILGDIWTLPNSLLGALVGIFALGLPRRIPGRAFLGVRGRCGIGPLVRRRGISATTFGSVVVFWRPGGEADPRLLDHEEVHVRQYRILGPVFLPIYLIFLPFTGYRERHPLEGPAYRRGASGSELDTRTHSRS